MHPANLTKLMIVGTIAAVLTTAGCATKKYVSKTIQPLEMGLHKANKNTQANAAEIRNVDRRAERGISEAQSSADQANEAAKTADQHAQAANQLAQQGVAQAKQAQQMADNMDNYAPAQHVTVLFALNKAVLTDSDQQKLSDFLQQVKTLKHYVIQVQGFTDKTGPKQFNLMLSQRRADAVVRYLTLNGDIPLVKIYRLGYGEAAPAHSNSTLKGRKLNRRVTVTVMVPQMPGAESQSAQATPPESN